MHYFNTTCPTAYHQNGFMATGVLAKMPMYTTFLSTLFEFEFSIVQINLNVDIKCVYERKKHDSQTTPPKNQYIKV